MNKNQRWARHRKELRAGTHVNKNMQASWNKYGENSFLFEVLEEVGDATLLFVVEQRYLDKYVGQEGCFNWSLYAGAPMRGKKGAETPNFGKPMTEAAKQKLREQNTGERHPKWGTKHSAETIAKIVEANKTNPWKGSRHTPEALEKIAAASKGRLCSEETRAKRSIALKGREVSTAQRLQISKTLSGEGNFWYGKQRPDSFKEKIRKPVCATDSNGVVTQYPSIQELRIALGLKAPTIHRALQSGSALTRGPFKGWSFAYAKKTLPAG